MDVRENVAGLLAFPRRSLPSQPCWSVALYGQTFRMGITAAGTAPDSHRIPLHRQPTGWRLLVSGAKVRNLEKREKRKREKCVEESFVALFFGLQVVFFAFSCPSLFPHLPFFLLLFPLLSPHFRLFSSSFFSFLSKSRTFVPDESSIPHSSTLQRQWQDHHCPWSDGPPCATGLLRPALQMRAGLHRYQVPRIRLRPPEREPRHVHGYARPRP